MIVDTAPRLMEEFERSLPWSRTPLSSRLRQVSPPKVFTLRNMPEDLGTHLSGTPRPPRSYGAMRLPQPRPSSMGSDQGSWDPMVVGT
jgi:hypothetical protein